MKILYVSNACMSSGAEDHMIDGTSWMKANGQEPVFLIAAGRVLEKQLGEAGIRFHPVFDGIIAASDYTGNSFILGTEGRKVLEDHFSIDAMGRNHLRHYQDVPSGTAGRR